MTDPNLNSVHLPLPRREEFRQARQVLLQARGPLTACHGTKLDGSSEQKDTAMEPAASGPQRSGFMLMAGEHTYPLKVGLNSIGRLSDNDVVLPDPYLSRRHCAVLVHANQICEVHDVASKNGTFLSGKRITCPTRIRPGDVLEICTHRLTLLRTGPEQSMTQNLEFPA